jgi:predicted transposase YbfD/YdcC
VKTDEKSNGNEVSAITAIPTLLEKAALAVCIVTIDAMGCQYKIAGQIVKKKADYLFSVKGNQESPHEDVADIWSDNILRSLISPLHWGISVIFSFIRPPRMTRNTDG